MKICTTCGQPSADDATVCEKPHCGGKEFTPEIVDQADAPRGDVDKIKLTPGRNLVVQSVAVRYVGVETAKGENQEGAPVNQPAPAQAANVQPPLPADENGDQAKVGRKIVTVDDLKPLIEAEGRLVICVLGFETAGKTWFLQRLKTCYPGWTIRPPAVAEGTTNSELARTGEITEHIFDCAGSNRHSFTVLDVPGEKFTTSVNHVFSNSNELFRGVITRSDAFIIVLPAEEALFARELADRRYYGLAKAISEGAGPRSAESLQKTINATKERYDEAVGDNRLLLLVEIERLRDELRLVELSASRGIRGVWDIEDDILMMKSLRPPEAEADQAERAAALKMLEDKLAHLREWRMADAAVQMNDFEDRLAHLFDLLRLGSENSAPNTVSGEEVGKLAEDLPPLSKPVFVALSKMDTVIDPSDWLGEKLQTIGVSPQVRAALDKNPDRLLRGRRQNLHEALMSRVEWCRIDCVTAFPLHGRERPASYISFEKAPYGVAGVIDWIRWACARKAGGWRSRLVTRLARNLRHAARSAA